MEYNLNNKVYFCISLFLFFICSCKQVNDVENISNEYSKLSLENVSELQRNVLIAKNDETDLVVEQNKIIGIKDKSTFKSIVLPMTLQEICNDAFQYCMQLEWIAISSTITKIESYAFYKCTSLHTIVIENPNIKIGTNVFEDCFSLQTIYFCGSLDKWQKASEKCNESLSNIKVICYQNSDELDTSFLTNANES